MSAHSTLKIFVLQLRKSKMLILLTALLPLGLWLRGPVLAIIASMVAAAVMLAAATALHEGLHLRAASKLGVAVEDVQVLGLGNVRYSLKAECPEKAVVAMSPYRSWSQYLFLILWLSTNVIIALYLHSWSRIFVLITALIPTIALIGSVCTAVAIESLPENSLCREIAEVLGSKGDIADIIDCRG